MKERDFLTGVGVFALTSKFGFGAESKMFNLIKITEYNLESMRNLSLRLMVAIVQPDDCWQIALGNIKVSSVGRKSSASVIFALFDPAVLLSAFLSNKDLRTVEHESIPVFVSLMGDMSN
ncbi:hypothetical protein PCCS19_21040 [Paenibacillus sp. CCS19]|nr:hypothetical protein PCCS19_21040 [Paenibacillus cellulosilyticus]